VQEGQAMSGQASQQSPAKPQTPYRKMYYIRVAFAIGGGILSGAMKVTGLSGLAYSYYGFAIALSLFIITYMLFKSVKSISSGVLDKNKYILTGIFSYFLLWFLTWTISLNLLFPV
jgi:hypothetical protein